MQVPWYQSVAAVAGSVLVATAFGQANPWMEQVPAHPVTVYWNVETDRNEMRWGSGTDWARQLNTGDVPVSRQVIMVYEHMFGIFPKEGPQAFLLNSTLMAQHLAKVRTDIAAEVPDVNYSGLLILDWESWSAMWDQTPAPVQANWKSYLESKNPNPLRGLTGTDEADVCRRTFEEATRRYFEATIDEMKRLRPKAKVGIYDYPSAYAQCEWVYTEVNEKKYKQRNDGIQWLWNKVDVFAPCIYSWRATVDHPSASRKYDCSEEEHRKFVRGLINETKRVAAGKPIYAYFWCRYGFTAGPEFDGKFHTELSLATAFDELKHSPAEGVVIWEVVRNRTEKDAFQAYISSTLVPQMRVLMPPSSDPAPGGGGTPGTGGSSGTEGQGSPGGTGGGGGGGGSSGGGGSGSGGGSVGSGSPAPTMPGKAPATRTISRVGTGAADWSKLIKKPIGGPAKVQVPSSSSTAGPKANPPASAQTPSAGPKPVITKVPPAASARSRAGTGLIMRPMTEAKVEE